MKATPSQSPKRPALRSSASVLLCAALLGACAVTPRPVEPDEVRRRVSEDVTAMYAGQEPVVSGITLEEAIARGLKYNLDLRLKKMESALALGLTDTAAQDMLPRLLATAGYRTRSNDSGGYARGILDGEVSTRPTTSDDRSHRLAGVEFSWNALDFGMSYYRARQLADQYLVAEERRRKVIQNIVQDVRTSYWRALGAQRLGAQAAQVLARAEQALTRSREAEAQKVISPVLALNYQRALLEATSQLNLRRQDLEIAKRELAALMNLPPGTDFTLAEAAETALPAVPSALSTLEEMALLQRPELREEDLRRRIGAAEVRRQLLGVLPGISFDAGVQYDSNGLAYNQRWSQGGVRLSWDLLRLAALPSIGRSHKAQEQTDATRRMALSMAVITQVRVGVERYRLAMEDFRQADEGAKVDQRLANYAQASVSARLDSELEAIRTQARALLGAYQRAHAYAGAQVAYGRLYNTLGFDPLPEAALDEPLGGLANRVREYLKRDQADSLRFSSNLFTASPTPVSVRVEGVEDPALRERVITDVVDVLLRQGLVIQDVQGAATIVLAHEPKPAVRGLRHSSWSVQLDGEPVQRHSVPMPTDARPSAEAAVALAALNLQLPRIRAWAAGLQSKEN